MRKQNTRVKVARKERNMSQKILADKVGCTQSMISRIESGEKIPSDRLKILLSKVLGKNIEWLFFQSKYD